MFGGAKRLGQGNGGYAEGEIQTRANCGQAKNLFVIISDRAILRHLPFRENQCEPQAEVFRTGLFYVDLKEPIIRQPISHIMKRDITHVPPDCSFHDAVKMLYEMKISCLRVIDDGKKLLGIVTVTDVIRGLPAAYALFEKVLA